MVVTNILQSLILFGSITALVLGSQYIKGRNRARIHETIDLAIRQGQPVPAELLELVSRREGSSKPASFLQYGLIFVGGGLGLAIFGQVLGSLDVEARTAITGVSAIPVCIGLACLAIEFIGRKRS
jgi:hypothetical protein